MTATKTLLIKPGLSFHGLTVRLFYLQWGNRKYTEYLVASCARTSRDLCISQCVPLIAATFEASRGTPILDLETF